MQPLLDLLDSHASCVAIDLTNRSWHLNRNIGAVPGWYFIRTDAPVDVLRRQTLSPRTYVTKGGKEKKVGRYDIAARAARFTDDMQPYWNTTEVYSGLAKSLQDRAREHTFPNDPGTIGLALGLYPELASYTWTFGFIRLDRLAAPASGQDLLLKLGEQAWRARNGWPLLCSA